MLRVANSSRCFYLVVISLLGIEALSNINFIQAAASDDNISAPAEIKSDDGTVDSLPFRSVGETEPETGFFQSIAVTADSPIYEKKSKYQDIAVHQASSYYGKILVLDGVVQLTERDGNAYNEMMAHIPMFQHEKPKRVLIIGGGDGYVLHEVLKHPSVEHVDHVDLDEEVIKTCEKYFSWGDAWNDKRVKLHIADGAAFVRDAETAFYDVIVQDSSDPWTTDDEGNEVILPSSVLYENEHFREIHRILKPDGIFNMQAETFQLPSDLAGVSIWRNKVSDVGFKKSRYGSLYISSYATGQIGFLLCEKKAKKLNIKNVKQRHEVMQKDKKTKTTYYHPGLQHSSFDLPLWVQEQIYGDDAPTLTCIESDPINEDTSSTT